MSEPTTINLNRVLTRFTYFELQRYFYGRDLDPDGRKVQRVHKGSHNSDEEKERDEYYMGAINLYRGLYRGLLRLPKARLFINGRPNRNWDSLLKEASAGAIMYDLDYIIKSDNTDIIPNDAFLLYYYFVIRDHKNPKSIKNTVTIDDFIPVMFYAIDPAKVQLDMSRLHPDFNFKMSIKEFVLIPLFYVIIEKPDEFKKQFENAILIMREFRNEICKYFDDCDAVFGKMELIYKWATDPNTTDIDPDNFVNFMKYIVDLSEKLSDSKNFKDGSLVSEIEKDYGIGIFKYPVDDVNKLIDHLEGELVRYYDIINSNYELEENGFDPNNYILGIIYELMSCGYYPAVTSGILPAGVYVKDPHLSNDNSIYSIEYCVPEYWCKYYYNPSQKKLNNTTGMYVAKDHQPSGDIPEAGQEWSPDQSIWNSNLLNSLKKLSDFDVVGAIKKVLYRIKKGDFDGLYRGINFSTIMPANGGNQLDTAMFHRYLASHITSHIFVASIGAEFTYKVASIASYGETDNSLTVMPLHAVPAIFPRIRIETEDNKFIFHVDDKNGWAWPPMTNPDKGVGEWTGIDAYFVSEVIMGPITYNLDNINIFEVDNSNPNLSNVVPDISLVGMEGKINKSNELTVHIEATAEQSNVSDVSKIYDYSTPSQFIADFVVYTKDRESKMPIFRINEFTYDGEKGEENVSVIDPEKEY